MSATNCIDSGLAALLACPRDQTPLVVHDGSLCCAEGHQYPIIDGVPVFLLGERNQTMPIALSSLEAAKTGTGAPLYIETLGLAEPEKEAIRTTPWRGSIDPVISWLVGATSGNAYTPQIGKLESYPIPNISFGDGHGHWLLDVGCNWGRWAVSAAQNNWQVVGIDPSLGAIMAGRRLAQSLNLKVHFVCGDARFMPFKAAAFAAVHSYSVLQHFAEIDVEQTLAEIRRVMTEHGRSRIQMAHKGGLRSRYSMAHPPHQGVFRVRYWSWDDLHRVFEEKIGPSKVRAEAYGGLGLLYEDRHFLSRQAKIAVHISALLKLLARFIMPLRYLADSVFVESRKAGAMRSE